MSSKDVGTLRTRLSWEDEGSARGLKGFKDDLKGLRSEMNAARSGGREYTQSLRGMREQSDILTRRLDVQRRQVQELRRRYEESRRVKGENAQQTRNLANQYNHAVAAMNRTENQLKGVTAAIKAQEDPWRRLSKSAEEAGRNMQTIGQSISSFGRSYTMRVTTPILGAAAAALKVGMDFEEGMSKVQALTQASESEMKSLSDQAKELGSTTRFSASQAADAMGFLGMAGWETSEIMAGMPGLLSLAAAGAMDLGRAADITSNIMSSFGIQAQNAGHVSDVLAAAASNANTSVEQMGHAMTYIAPVANTLGWTLEESAAAVMSMSDAGLQGEKAGAAFATSLQRLAKPSKEASAVMKDLKLSFFEANGEIKPLPNIIEELEKKTSHLNNEQKAAALTTIFGAEAYKNWAVMLEAGSKTIGGNTEMLIESEGAAKKMADTMSANAKGAITEFRSALEGAGIAFSEHMIPAVTEFIQKGTELIRKFGELDDETQKQIIKWGLLVAAVGPAALVLGNITTTVGGAVRVVGMLSGAIAGAGGLTAATMGLINPVTLGIAAVGGLGYGIYQLYKHSQKAEEVNLNLANSLMEEEAALRSNIDRYEELKGKLKLSNSELEEFVDLQSRIKRETDPTKIAILRDRQAELAKKSGATNEELEELLGLNNRLVEELPDSTVKITEQGNVLLDSTGALKDYNNEQRERIRLELRSQLALAEANHLENLREQERLAAEINGHREKVEELEGNIELKTREIKNTKAEIAKAEKENNEHNRLFYENNLALQERDLQLLKDQLVEEWNRLIAKRDQLDATEAELDKIEEIKGKLVEVELAQVGINGEKDEGIKKLDEAIKKEEKAIGKLRESQNEQAGLNQEVQNEINEREKVLAELKNAKGAIDNVTGSQKLTTAEIFKSYMEAKKLDESLSLNDYLKKVNVTDDGTLAKLEERISRPVYKRVSVTESIIQKYNLQPRAYAVGTPIGGHPGGPFIAGEEGFELGRMGNRWELLNLGMYDRPRGYEVFTHDESKKIISALNHMPAYATGARSPGEADRVIKSLNDQQANSNDMEPIVLQLNITNTMDGRVVGQVVEEHVTNIQDRKKRVRERFA
ncbi:phage tail tape measure protein [Halalkalibacter krulwichiae]|uniref:Phage-related minor tail protein n=1 Tax=Halalkalibacter krulwichiae TaxID=199441 RepID=A0A1X9MF98_9BACI|nr:phage tail tape measure protein [Halalkalibacter krulwichiae]ARK32127.1 Phage-related minor tail protein [Halalkalibacter krulwichiae]